MARTVDLTGRRLGAWTVIERVDNASNGNAQWLCRCQCGAMKIVRATRLRSMTTSHSCYDCAVKTGHGDISGDHWSRIRGSADRRSLSFNLTIEQAWQLFLEQNQRCALSGIDITFRPKTASLDRIDSTVGYIIENVQWVHKDVNKMKQDFSEERFKTLCRLVTKL